MSPKLLLTSAVGLSESLAELFPLIDGVCSVPFVLSVALPLQVAHWHFFVWSVAAVRAC